MLCNKTVLNFTQTGVSLQVALEAAAMTVDCPTVCRYRLALLRSQTYGNTRHAKHAAAFSSSFVIAHRRSWRNLHVASVSCNKRNRALDRPTSGDDRNKRLFNLVTNKIRRMAPAGKPQPSATDHQWTTPPDTICIKSLIFSNKSQWM